jgi:2-amino-4-hydroxy-6-hydroxymethyldihydropteridine diphosphokinase
MIILGLGTNVGDRLAQLSDAVRQISDDVLENISISSIYESDALLPEGAPEMWDQPFYNIAIAGTSTLTPEALLARVQNIETAMGREVKDKGTWAPRCIDIDILLYNDASYALKGLDIPHLALTKRPFAILPAAEIAPDAIFTGAGNWENTALKEIAAQWNGEEMPFNTTKTTIPFLPEETC